jgi:hypothetical protein
MSDSDSDLTVKFDLPGFGFWVAFERAISDGSKKVDLEKAIDICQSTGAEWIAVRASAGGNDDADLNAESIQAYHDAGIEPIIWIFDYAGRQQAELADFERFRKMGVTKAILNAEFEYIPASGDEARALVKAVRALGYEQVFHAPPCYAGARGDGALKVLDKECDKILPQVYAFEINDQGHVHHITSVMEGYAKRGYGPDKVSPILCSYRPKTRGYTKEGKPIPTPHMDNEPQRVAEDVVAGLKLCESMGISTMSIYSIDALHFIDQKVGDAVLAAVETWADQSPTTKASLHTPPGPSFPDTAANPIGRADRAEQEYEETHQDQDQPQPRTADDVVITSPETPSSILRSSSSPPETPK